MTTEVSAKCRDEMSSKAVPPGRRSIFQAARQGRPSLEGVTLVDATALALCGLGLFAIAPHFYYVQNPRQALLLAALPLGSYLLIRRAWSRDRASMAAGVVLVLAALSALRSPEPQRAFLGSIVVDVSWLALLGAFAVWAIGREMSAHGRRLLPLVATAALVPSLLIGFLQLFVDPRTGIYSTAGGRPAGLMSNPVYYASVLVGVWAYWLARTSSLRHRTALIAPVLAVAMGTTGSRGAIAGALLVGVVVLMVKRTREAGGALIASAVGFAAGLLLLATFARATTERLQGTGGGFGIRRAVWRATIDAWADRPLLGWGPDPFLHAVNERLTVAYAQDFDFLVWTDPHNVVLLVLVSTGLLGVAAMLAFGGFALRGEIDFYLLIVVPAIVLSWMLQPVTLNSWPIVFLFLGAAVRSRQWERSLPPVRPAAIAVLTGAVIGALFLAWSFVFVSAGRSDDPDHIERRASFFISDPAVRLSVAGAYGRTSLLPDVTEAEMIRRLERAESLAQAVVDGGGHPKAWVVLVQAQLELGQNEEAFATTQDWVDRRPIDPFAYRWLVTTASITGRPEVERSAQNKLCEIGYEPCVAAD